MSATLDLPPLPVLIDPPPPQHPPATGDTNYWKPSVWNHILFGWGCVRFDETDQDGYVVPRMHMNEAHNTSGVVSVSASRDVPAEKRDLLFTTEGGGDIGTMFVLPDETMTAMGVTCGPSGGQPTTRVPLLINGVRYPANSSRFYGKWANLWCFWLWAKDGPSPIVQAFDRVAQHLLDLMIRAADAESKLCAQQTAYNEQQQMINDLRERMATVEGRLPPES